MQTDDLPSAGKLSRTADPCLWRENLAGKIAGFDGIFEGAQTWIAGGHSKNTWFMDSSWAPHLPKQIPPCIPLACKFFFTVIHPVTNCHRKCFNFGGHYIFQQKAFRTSIVGQINNGGLSLSG